MTTDSIEHEQQIKVAAMWEALTMLLPKAWSREQLIASAEFARQHGAALGAVGHEDDATWAARNAPEIYAALEQLFRAAAEPT